MVRECNWCGNGFEAKRLLVFADGSFCCDGCVNSASGTPPFINLQLTWNDALALESILKGEVNLELIEIREDILEDLSKVILKVLKGLVRKDDKV